MILCQQTQFHVLLIIFPAVWAYELAPLADKKEATLPIHRLSLWNWMVDVIQMSKKCKKVLDSVCQIPSSQINITTSSYLSNNNYIQKTRKGYNA